MKKCKVCEENYGLTESQCKVCGNYVPLGLSHKYICVDCLTNNTKQIRQARYNNINDKHNDR